jgi:hypothetical protein
LVSIVTQDLDVTFDHVDKPYFFNIATFDIVAPLSWFPMSGQKSVEPQYRWSKQPFSKKKDIFLKRKTS